MTLLGIVRVAAAVALISMPAAAQDADAITTADTVRAEIAEAMAAVSSYSEQERDRALAEARDALDRLDAEIDRRERVLRENWAEMSAASRQTAEEQLTQLRQARNRLGERYGALEAGTSNAWDALTGGFAEAWTAFSDAWTAADSEPPGQ